MSRRSTPARLGRQIRVITSLVFRNRNPIGVIVVLPLGGSAQTRSQVSDRKADLRGSKDLSDARYVFEDIVTASPLMADAIALARRVAASGCRSFWPVGQSPARVIAPIDSQR